MRTYNVSDLFFTRWEDLSPKVHATVYTLQQELINTPRVAGQDGQANVQYGIRLIAVLRHLRKNKMLVDKINVTQAVDIYNDLKFLNEPWYFFPEIEADWAVTPLDKMAKHTFDHFIYADNEFSKYLVTQDVKYLRYLVATLYQVHFDKENVEILAQTLKAKEWQLVLVFATYAHVREFVMNRCKLLLPKPIHNPDAEPAKPQPTGRMWLQLKHRLAETPAFQGYETTSKANMYSALDYLEDLVQQKEQKR